MDSSSTQYCCKLNVKLWGWCQDFVPGQYNKMIWIDIHKMLSEKEREFFFFFLQGMKSVLITFDISVNLPLRVQILQPLQYFPQYSSYVRLFKRSWTELGRVRENMKVRQISQQNVNICIKLCKLYKNISLLTRSRADPPPKYSMIIHSLVPWEETVLNERRLRFNNTGLPLIVWHCVCIPLPSLSIIDVCIASFLVLSSHL